MEETKTIKVGRRAHQVDGVEVAARGRIGHVARVEFVAEQVIVATPGQDRVDRHRYGRFQLHFAGHRTT